MSASVRDQMPKPSCVSCQLGSPTTTRFTRTRLSDIVHPVSSSQLTQDPDRVRSFGGYNTPQCRVFQNFESVASTTVARRSTEKEAGWSTLWCNKQATVVSECRFCDGHHIAKAI